MVKNREGKNYSHSSADLLMGHHRLFHHSFHLGGDVLKWRINKEELKERCLEFLRDEGAFNPEVFAELHYGLHNSESIDKYLLEELCNAVKCDELCSYCLPAARGECYLINHREALEFKEKIDYYKEDLFYTTKSGKKLPRQREFAINIIDKFHAKTITETDEILYYEDGVYKYHGEKRIKEYIEKIHDTTLGSSAKKHHVAEILDAVRRRTYINRREFNSGNFINLKNCIIEIDNEGNYSKHPHSSEYLSTIQIPVDFDERCKCPNIDQFISEIVHQDDVDTLYELIAYCLMSGYPYDTIFILVGDGANGKSTFLKLLRIFLGERNTTGVEIQQLGERFAASCLVDKLANIVADLPTRPIRGTNRIKGLTGGDYIRAEKKFQHPFEFENSAKLIFSTNELPEVYDTSYGWWRRPIIIKFPYRFGEGGKPKIEREVLLKQLTTPKELSGLLNRCLEAIKRLKQRGGFKISKQSLMEKDEWRRSADTVRTYAEERLEYVPNEVVSKRELFSDYRTWCYHNGFNPLHSDAQIARRLYTVMPQVRSRKMLIRGERLRCFVNVRIRADDDYEEDGDEKEVQSRLEV